MTVPGWLRLDGLRVAGARLQQQVGWAGVAGLLLVAAAAVLLLQAWRVDLAAQRQLEQLQQQAATLRDNKPTTVAVPAPAPWPEWPAAEDAAQLVRQMEQAAVQHGLVWRAADYRLVPDTAAMPGSLEVRCTITGPYPQLRGMLVQLLRDEPALAIREFSATRPTADVAEIQAKLVLAVFLRDTAGLAAQAGLAASGALR